MPARTFLRFFLVVGFSQITLSACATTEQQTAQSAPVYYSDCGQISLDGKDGRNLTREELIAAEEQALFDALDASSECNKKALNAGQQAVTAAGAASGNSGASVTAKPLTGPDPTK